MTLRNQDTRDIINTARDLLVGKVPTPIDQCEEITRALIYKYISAVAVENVELGGKARYFTGDGEELRWDKMMAPEQTANSILRLYTRGLEMLGSSSDIPAAFQTIYRDAYLPYNDAVVLRDFLQTVDRFDTRDTEQIGDAYEMMLQTFGAQAAAGQFRTPRHIIDFIVGIVNPQKHETILDPACGTAGFLASAYQHVAAAGALTPLDRSVLADNTVGYDISPQMARIATVNLYLTHRQEPKIAVYDTLTGQDKWNDHYDVILANPPFMSPKGGIRPHGRFFSSSKRSEVLFVDYIMGHLNDGGRAGVIVPEGIIFQSQRAHTQLRRLLVETALVAVVSLPGGVFQPYSGVKTSILILDKALARRADGIAFFKVENDGYDLGAQRRPISQDDLPAVTGEINEYLRRVREDDAPGEYQPTLGRIVAKSDIAADGDYNLSGERYQSSQITNSEFPVVPLGEIAEMLRGITFGKGDQLEAETNESLRVVTTRAAQESGIVEDALYHISAGLLKDNDKLLRPGDILISTANSLNLLGRTTHVQSIDRPTSFGAFMSVIRPNEKVLDTYLLGCLRTEFATDFFRRNANTTTNISNLNLSVLARFEIPLPPLEVQREIVAEIEGYQRVLDGARAVVDNWRPRIAVDPDWPLVELGELTKPQYGYTASAADEGDARFVRITDIGDDGMLRSDGQKYISLNDKARKLMLNKGDILVARTGSYGKTMMFDENYPAVFASYLIRLRFSEEQVNPRYYWAFAQTGAYWEQAHSLVSGGVQPQFNGNVLKHVKLPLPPLATQQAIVAEIQAEQALVSANRELAQRMAARIASAIGRVWYD